jgi:hypothetical protein
MINLKEFENKILLSALWYFISMPLEKLRQTKAATGLSPE